MNSKHHVLKLSFHFITNNSDSGRIQASKWFVFHQNQPIRTQKYGFRPLEHEEVVVMGYDVRRIHRPQFWPVARALDDGWVNGPVMQIRARCMEDGRFVRERIFRCSDVSVDRKEMPCVVMLN